MKKLTTETSLQYIYEVYSPKWFIKWPYFLKWTNTCSYVSMLLKWTKSTNGKGDVDEDEYLLSGAESPGAAHVAAGRSSQSE